MTKHKRILTVVVFAFILANIVASLPSLVGTTASAEAGTTSVQAYLPVVMKEAYGGWTSRMHIRNNGPGQSPVTVEYYDQAGNLISTDSETVAAGGTWVVNQSDNPSLPQGFAGSSEVLSPQPATVAVDEIPRSGDAITYDGVAAGGTTLHLPVVLNGAYGGWSTGVSVMNTGDGPAGVTITYYDSNGKVAGKCDSIDALPSRGYWGVFQGGGQLPAGFIGSATVISSQPVVATVNEVNYGPIGGGATTYTGLDKGATTVHFPAVMNNAFGGWTTGMSLVNVGSAQGMVTIQYYDSSGSIAGREQRTLGAGGCWGVYQGAGQLPPGFSGTATVTSDQPLVGIVNEVNYVGTGAFSYVGTSEGATQVYFPAILSGGDGKPGTGLSVRNLSDESAKVNISFFDTNGNLVVKDERRVEGEGALSMSAGEDLLPTEFKGSAVVESDQPIAALTNRIQSQAGHSEDFPLGVFDDFNALSPTSFAALIDDAKAHNLDSAMLTNGWVKYSDAFLSVSDSKGFNTYVGPVGELERQWFHPTEFGNPEVTLDIASARQVIYPMVDKMSSHPSLKGYYIIDEPSADQQTKVSLAVQAFQERDQRHPAFPVLIGTDRVGPIFSAAKPNAMVIDVYPYSWRNGPCDTRMTGYGYNMDMVSYIRQVTATKPSSTPLWVILQGHQVGDGSSGYNLRQPSPAEARIENWVAIGEGAKGIFWFLYDSIPSSGLVGFRDNPALYAEIANLAGRVAALRPLLVTLNKAADQFTVFGSCNPYVSTLSDGTKKFAVVVNRSGSTSSISVRSSLSGKLRDVETNQMYSLNKPIQFAAGDGRIFELVP
jgi:hypothetical protein